MNRSLSQHNQNNDIVVGLLAYPVWGVLGWHDIRQRYRRSILGPFWFTLSTAIMVIVLGSLYSILLQQDVRFYVPYLAIGLIIWQFLSTCVLEGCTIFTGSAFMIKQIRLPLTVYVCRHVWRNFVIFLHSLPIAILALIFYGVWPNEHILFLPLGILLLLINSIWISIVLGIVSARFRDIQPIMGNFMQIGFFFTPVMWTVEILKDRAWVANYNPLYHLIEIVRAPVLGQPAPLQSWMWAIGIAMMGFILAQWLMVRYRNRVAYWL